MEKFPPSSTDYFKSRGALPAEVSNWSHSKGFTLSTEGSSLRYQKYEEPTHYSKARKKNPVPEHKRRRKVDSPRCNCAFVIKFTLASCTLPGVPPNAVIIGSQYLHTGGCLPYPQDSQLVSMKLASGQYSKVQLTKNRLHVLVDLVMRNTNTPIPTSVLRDIICPLVPESVPLNCNFLFNIKYKIKKWLDKESQSLPSAIRILQLTELPSDLFVPTDLDFQPANFIQDASLGMRGSCSKYLSRLAITLLL
jgi:hypothetical protein